MGAKQFWNFGTHMIVKFQGRKSIRLRGATPIYNFFYNSVALFHGCQSHQHNARQMNHTDKSISTFFLNGKQFMKKIQSKEFLLKYFVFPTSFKPFCRCFRICCMVKNTGNVLPVIALCVAPCKSFAESFHIAETAQDFPIGHIAEETFSSAMNVIKIFMVQGFPITICEVKRIKRMK